jgi:hypothetical protein
MNSSCFGFDLDRQLFLATLIGDLPWAYGVHSAVLSFGDHYSWYA